MTSTPFDEDEIFKIAREIASPTARAAYLQQTCGNDQALRRRLESLLKIAAEEQSFLERPAVELAATGLHRPDWEGPGDAIGPYKLLQPIGEGGMGTVWMAEQHEPVRRRVALKVIKAGMDNRQVLARFEAERQALSLMDHPNIAKVLDAGTTERGRPYFVMELVKGQPITQYCDEHRLNSRERLELFLPVCHAIQHAHHKGIIHRDIKPSNVLLAEYDGQPVPKVIDFGVAKAVHQPLTERTMFTGLGQIIGTLEYMSPEQARVNQLDIDTRSDVYSLGVLLYELLTGSTPFDKKRMREAALDELLRIIREEEPPRPSAKLSSSQTLPSIAANRKTEPARLAILVRGELDWIIMKALEKDRNRRYETANGFALDIQRYLSDEAVMACPPSAAYRFRKFARKNKVLLATTTLVSAALVLGLIGTTWQAYRATRAEALAVTNEQLALAARDEKELARRQALASADQARQAAEREAEQRRLAEAAAAAELVAKLAAEANEQRAVAAAEKERQANERSAARLKQIEMINTTVFEIFSAFDIRETKKGKEPVEAVLTQQLIKAGQKLDKTAIQDPLVLASIQAQLGLSLLSLGRPREALPFLASAHDLQRRHLPPDHPSTLTSLNNLAMSHLRSGTLAKALPLLEQLVERSKVTMGSEDPTTLGYMNNLAACYLELGQFGKALPVLEDTYRLIKETPAHRDLLTVINNLGVCYKEFGQHAQALPLFERNYQLLKEKWGVDHPDTLLGLNNLAHQYWLVNDLDHSIALFEEGLKLKELSLGRSHPDTLQAAFNLGVNYRDAGRFSEAVPLLEEGYRAAKSGLESRQRQRGIELLHAYLQAGENAKADGLSTELLEDARRKWPHLSPELAQTLSSLSMALLREQKYAAVEPLLRECLLIREQSQPDDWTTYNTYSLLGGSLLGQQRYAEAEPLLLKGYEGMKARAQTIPVQGMIRLPEALDRLISLYQLSENVEAEQKWVKERELYSLGKSDPGVRLDLPAGK